MREMVEFKNFDVNYLMILNSWRSPRIWHDPHVDVLKHAFFPRTIIYVTFHRKKGTSKDVNVKYQVHFAPDIWR